MRPDHLSATAYQPGDPKKRLNLWEPVSWSVKWSQVWFPGHGTTLPDGELSRVLLATTRREQEGVRPLDTFFEGLFFNPQTIKVTLPEHTVQWFSVYSQGWATTPNSRPFHPPGDGNQRAWPPPPNPSPTPATDCHPLAPPWPCPFWTFHISTITQHVASASEFCHGTRFQGSLMLQQASVPHSSPWPNCILQTGHTLCTYPSSVHTGLFPPPRSSEQSCCGHLHLSFCVDIGFVSPRSPPRAEQPGPLLAPRLLFGGAAGLSSRCAHPRQPQTRILTNTGYRLSSGASQPSGCEMVSPWSSDLHFPES